MPTKAINAVASHQNAGPWDAFELEFLVPFEEIEFELRGMPAVPWMDFLINPRRLRGSDFLMRWSQGRWSEERLVQAINSTSGYFALPYGPSGTAPGDDIRAIEQYFERLDAASVAGIKRPDLLAFRKSDEGTVMLLLNSVGGVSELPFVAEDAPKMRELLRRAVLAIECENSLWKARRMPDFGKALTPQRRLGGKPGLKKSAIVPTIILKHEDLAPLLGWQDNRGIEVHVWHVFYDVAYGISLDRARDLMRTKEVGPTNQRFQAPGGATTEKVIYKIPYYLAYEVGETTEEPGLVAAYIEDANGHILPYVKFEGGRLALSREARGVLDKAARKR